MNSLFSARTWAPGWLLITAFWASAVTPNIVVREEALRAIDQVELHGNGLYWWTSSACSGDVIDFGGAAYIAYADPRFLSASATLFGSPITGGGAGGFAPGDRFDLGLSISAQPSARSGSLQPACGYGGYVVRDDEALYFAKNRILHRRPFSATPFAPDEPIRFLVGLQRASIAADGVLFATDTEVWSYSTDLPRQSLTLIRTWKSGTRDISHIREVLTMPGASLRKAAMIDIQSTDGNYLGTELILLSPDGHLYRAGINSGRAQLIRTKVNDFALRNEVYLRGGGLAQRIQRATTLYMAVDNLITPQSNGQLLGVDLTPNSRAEFVEYTAGPNFRVTSVAVDKQRIFLTRTPGSNQANSDLLRRAAPAEPTLANPGEPDFATIALAREFRSLRSTGRMVYFAHANTVQRLEVNAPAITLDFEAIGIEVTQAIQNLNNTVPLVAGRRVFVRGYARLAANTTGLPAFDVPAQLRVLHTPITAIGSAVPQELAGSPFLPVLAPAVAPVASLHDARTNLNATFLFEVPESTIQEGDLRFEFVLNPGRSVPETGAKPLVNNTAASTLKSRAIEFPALVFAPMGYGGSFYDHTARGNDLWDIVARARTLLPVAGFRIAFRNAPVWKPVIVFPGLVKMRSFDMPANKDASLLWLTVARFLDSHPLNAHYVGMFPPDVSGFNGIGSRPGRALVIRMSTDGPSNAPWNSVGGGRTLAHEYAHNLGFRHIPTALTCTTQAPDGPYDSIPGSTDGCSLGATDLNDPAVTAGFDPLSWSIVQPAANGDLMSYATTRWMTDYNWKRMYDLFIASQEAAARSRQSPARSPLNLAAPAAGGLWLILHGIVDLAAATAEFLPAHSFPESSLAPEVLRELTSLPADLPANHPIRLQILDAAGALIEDQPCPLEAASEGTVSSLRRALPLPPGARSVRLLNGAASLARIDLSPSAPSVAMDPPQVAGNELTLSWQAADPDNDPLLFTVQLSPDDGKTWQTLQVNVAESTIKFATDLLAGGPTVRARVVATDGARSATAVSAAFALPKHKPSVRISGVGDGEQLDFGALRSATGFGYDPDQGSLADEALQWALTGPESRQSSGASFTLANLAPGAYTLTLTGTDADGQTGSATIRFTARPLRIGEGETPRLDGLCADPGYAKTPPIRFAAAGGRYSIARFVHAGGYLYVCFSGLRYGADGGAGAIAGLRVNPGSSDPAAAVTAGFAVNQNGEPLRVSGSGTNFTALTSPPPGFSAAILRDETTWSAEMKIADALLGGWKESLGFVVFFDPGNPASPAATWPPNAILDRPESWTTAQPGPLPPRELITNGSFENTANTFVRDGNGLMTLRTGATAVPGWTVTAGEPAWIDNANAFRATSPHGNYFLDLTGYADQSSTLAQTIPTVPGRAYRLSLALGSNADFPGANRPKAVAVCAGPAARLFHMIPIATAGDEWSSFNFVFTATASSTEISIRGVAGGIYLGLDNVSVIEESTAIPPETAELVTNGSFEESCPLNFAPDSNGVMSLQPGSTAITGWTTTGAEIAWGFNANAFGPASPHGELFLDLTGYHDSPPYGGISQHLATTPGQRYRLSFSLGAHQDIAVYRGPITVEASAGDTTRSFTFTPAGTGNQWSTFTMDFSASAASTLLSVVGQSTAGGAYLGLDNISVLPASSAAEFRITAITAQGIDLTIQFKSESGKRYVVQTASDIASGSWENLSATERTGTGASVAILLQDALRDARRFYRIAQQP